MSDTEMRAGEVALHFDPAETTFAGVIRIGQLSTPWARGNCPKYLNQARDRGGVFQAHVDMPFRPALLGLEPGMTVVLLYWMGQARRDLLVQAPAHRSEPTGTFALRSPARPNPFAMAVVRLVAIDRESGVLELDAADAFDGTILLDIKPWLPSIDMPRHTEK